MMSEENKKVVLAYVEAFNHDDIETMRQLFTPEALIYGVLGWGDVDKVIPIWKEIRAAFAIELNVVDIIAEGDVVAVRYLERGTSVGEWRGHPPTGRGFEVVAMEWFILKDGKIHRRWGARDNASQLRQMGLPLE